MADRIKGLRQKLQNNSYGDFVPFGSEGEYIDMFSGLSLEQEFLLGGTHQVYIKEVNNTTIIIDNYGGVYCTRTTISHPSSVTDRIVAQLYDTEDITLPSSISEYFDNYMAILDGLDNDSRKIAEKKTEISNGNQINETWTKSPVPH